jgi:integrase
MAAKTVYTELTVVRQWLNFAVTRRMLTMSPVAGTKLVKPKPGPRDYWREDQLDAIIDAAKGPYKAAYLLIAETGMRVGEVIHLTWDDLLLAGRNPVAHIRPKEVVPDAKPWRPKNGEQRAVQLSPRAVAMLRDLPRRRRWVIDRMNGTKATATKPANDRHILAYLKTVLTKLGLEGTSHKFRHSFCTIAVLAGVDFFTLRRWVGHLDEEALKIYVHIADEQAQQTMRQLSEHREADRSRAAGKRSGKASRAAGGLGADAKAEPAKGRHGISKVSAKSRR